MALFGNAAMLLSFDIVPDAIVEHDDWHTHEHFPERLSVPGFLRGTRWIAQQAQPRYFVMYEVERLDILASAPYLERLNNPTPWTTQMMTQYRGMTRGLCRCIGSFGVGLGQAALFLRFKPGAGKETALREWLLGDALPALPAQVGLASAYLFEGSLAAPVTNEQRIRGKDAAVESALLVTGYSSEAVAALSQGALGESKLVQYGATGIAGGVYQMAYALP